MTVRECAGILVYRDESLRANDTVYSISCLDGTNSNGTQSRMVVCGKRGRCAAEPPTIPTTVSTTPSPTTTELSTTTITSLSTTTDCPVKVCRDGWYKTSRNGQVWCIHVFFKWTKHYQDASDYCVNTWNSVLSGPNSQDEYNYAIGQTAVQQDILEGFDRGGYEKVWMMIGAQRTPECTTDPGVNPQCALPNVSESWKILKIRSFRATFGWTVSLEHPMLSSICTTTLAVLPLLKTIHRRVLLS